MEVSYVKSQQGKMRKLELIKKTVEDMSNKIDFSGTILLMEGNKPIAQVSKGYATKKDGIEIMNKMDTIFSIGSLTKSYTATGIMQLIQRSNEDKEHKLNDYNRISLDDTIDKWYKDFPKGNEISVRQLLDHSSGLKNCTNPEYRLLDEKVTKADDIIKRMQDLGKKNDNKDNAFEKKKDGTTFKPGEALMYCNTGYIILGDIIKKVSGEKSYEDYIEKNIINKGEKLENTFVGYDKYLKYVSTKGHYYDYLSKDNIVAVDDNDVLNKCGFGACSIYTSASDLKKFLDKLESGILVDPTYVKDMSASEVSNEKEKDIKREEVKVGFGFFTKKYSWKERIDI